ncbi:MAG: Isoprenyl transferase [Ignavibacteria bacterium]|nr:Isoprenyl transferase [Ignavibacteria bacterium]
MSWNEQQGSEDKNIQQELLKNGNLPKHIAMIMDGNGRWAVKQNLNRIAGHREGIETVRDIVKACSQLGIKYLTLYAFSIENWKRPTSEVGGLMRLLEFYLRRELKELNENKVKMFSIGKVSSLPKSVQKLLHRAIDTTKDNDGLTLTLALSYSGRWDIVRAVQMLSLDVRRGKISPEDINEEFFAGYLQTNPLPDPDFVIRTSGEMRLSNFLLWENAYSEFYITEKYWPEFRRNELYKALAEFQHRERRFGKTSEQITNKEIEDQNTYLKRILNAINMS